MKSLKKYQSCVNRKHQHKHRETVPGFVSYANEAFYDAMEEKKRSSAVTPHVSKEYKGTKKSKKDKAIKESLNSYVW